MDFYEFLLDGDFGWEINISRVAAALKEAEGKDLKIMISSNGGDVQEASAIYYMINDYRTKNDAKIDFEIIGGAQSAASFLTAMTGANVAVSPTSTYMIHNPYSFIMGDHAELLKQSVFLSNLTDAYANQYKAKTGKEFSEVVELMAATTRLVGQQIIDAGFADEMRGDLAGVDTTKSLALAHASKKDFDRTMQRVSAAALGVDGGIDRNQINKGEIEMGNKEIKKENTPSASAQGDNQPAVISDDARAAVCMDAIAKCPEDGTLLRDKFVAGASAGFFEGFMAHKDQILAVAKAEAAAKESKDEIGDVKPKAQDTAEPAQVKTYGATGQKVSV